MADVIYNRFSYNLGTKKIDLLNDDIRVALLDNTFVPNARTQNVWADISAKEVSGTGYTTLGAALSGKSYNEDDTNGGVWFDSSDITWANSTITARYAVLFDNSLPGKDLIAAYDFTTDKISSGGDFVLTVNQNGWFKIS